MTKSTFTYYKGQKDETFKFIIGHYKSKARQIT